MVTRERARYAQRLNKLADYLLTLPRARYNHSAFVSDDEHPCGTVACALGHAVLVADSKFPGLGMRWNNKLNKKFGWFNFKEVATVYDTPSDRADTYFGPGAYDACFASHVQGRRRLTNIGAATLLRKHAKRMLKTPK